MTAAAAVHPGVRPDPEPGHSPARNMFYVLPCPRPAIGFHEPEREPGPKPPADRDPLSSDHDLDAAAEALVGQTLAQIERRVIEATVRGCGGSLPRAAQVLGVSPSTLYRKRAGWRD